MTRAPTTCARQHRSSASPWAGMPSSKPLSASNRSTRTSMQPDGTMKTSRTASCCSWSSSPGSQSGTRTPALSAPIPTESSRSGSSHSTSFGPTMPAFDRKASSTSWRTVAGSSATSSWRKKKKPRAFDELQRLVRGRSEPRVGVEPADVGPGKPGGDRCSHVAFAARVDDEHREVRVVLSGERGQQLVEPCAGIVGNQHGDDRRRRLRLGLHNGPRLAAGRVRTGAHGGSEEGREPVCHRSQALATVMQYG